MATSLLDRLFSWISSGCSDKPNDPPHKPAGFVCISEAVRPAAELQLNVDGEPHDRKTKNAHNSRIRHVNRFVHPSFIWAC